MPDYQGNHAIWSARTLNITQFEDLAPGQQPVKTYVSMSLYEALVAVQVRGGPQLLSTAAAALSVLLDLPDNFDS